MLPLVLGGLGAVGGGLGGAALAGKYMPKLGAKAYEAADMLRSKAAAGLYGAAKNLPGVELEGAALGGLGKQARDVQAGLQRAAQGIGNIPLGAVEGLTNIALPGAIGLAGATSGAAALSGLGQAFMPQQEIVDPESYGSSNSMGARYKPPTMQYV